MSFYYNSGRSPRLVECFCGHVFRSQVQSCQCSECKIRFEGDDRLHKNDEDRANERKEMDKKMLELETQFEQAVSVIKQMRKQLKPLD